MIKQSLAPMGERSCRGNKIRSIANLSLLDGGEARHPEPFEKSWIPGRASLPGMTVDFYCDFG